MASFAQLRPDELLVETERAVGDAALHALHMDLIESRGELAALERARAPALPRSHTCLDPTTRAALPRSHMRVW